jgi:excisionase family DNA binding protein
MLRITVPTVYGLVHRKKIPYIKFGKKLMFEKAVIHSWLKNFRRKTLYEIQEDCKNIVRRPKK